MKKWIGLFLALMLMLAVSSAFAGGPAEGNITVTDLQTNTYLTGDTVLTIDQDGEEQSICGKTKDGDFTLKFVGGGHFLTFNNNSGAAVSAKSITFQNCHIILPLGGSVKNGTVCNASGSPASYVVIGPTDYYGIEIVDGISYNWSTTKPCTYAKAGVEIGFAFKKDKCPGGKYQSSYKCEPSTLGPYNVMTEYAFIMPQREVRITPVYSAQKTGIVDFRFEDAVNDDDYSLFLSLDYAGDFGLVKMKGTGECDLDKNGTYDVCAWACAVSVMDTNSVTGSITLKPSKAAKYNPLTFVFSNPTVSFKPNGGKGSMASVEITAADLKYTLPKCTFTPPEGKVFDRWDKGAPGTVITVASDTTLTPKWKARQIKASGGIYVLNTKEKTATLVKAANKNAKSLKIPAAITYKGKKYKVTAIKDSACKGMTKLRSVLIGKNVTFIGKNAFAGCTKLKTITIKNQKMKKSGFGSGCFARIQKKAVFYVPSKAFNNYKKWIVNRGKAPSTCMFIKK